MFLNSIILSIFLHYIAKVTSTDLIEVSLPNSNTAPLAVSLKNGELILAKPCNYLKNSRKTTFLCDNTKKNDCLALACPARTENQLEQQTEWNTRNAERLKGVQEIVLFPGDRIDCDEEIIPTISKDENSKKCHKRNSRRKGIAYKVGYLVWNLIDKTIKFVTVYNFCYTKKSGTLYTVHRIQSPHLLKIKNDYITDIIYDSFLDANNSNRGSKTWWEEPENENFEKYQLVDHLDMAVNSWKLTTLFSFNHIPLENSRIKKYLNTINNYIRYFAKKNRVELTVYSGKYKYTISKPTWDIIHEFKEKYAPVSENFVWKLIHDDQYNTIVIITHLPPYKNCKILCAYNPVTIDESKENGCTYTCQVDRSLLSHVGLQNFKSKGFLIFDLPKIVNSNEDIYRDGDSNNSRMGSNTVNISSFLKNYDDFESAVSVYEAGKPIDQNIPTSEDTSGCILM